MTTATTHRRIEQIAAAFIDLLPSIESNPDTMAKAGALAALEPGFARMAAGAARLAAIGETTTLVSRCRGPELAISQAVIVDVLYGKTRPGLTWCPHRHTFDGDPLLVSAALRYAGCTPCCITRAEGAAKLLAADSTCDVCGGDNGKVRPRLMPHAAAMVSIYTGRCCDPLFDFDTPGAITTTFRKLGRNEPCPCGSTRKFKRCHGAVKV